MPHAKYSLRALCLVILLRCQGSRASWRWIDDSHCEGLPSDPDSCGKGIHVCQSIVDGGTVMKGWACMFKDAAILVPSSSRSLQEPLSKRSIFGRTASSLNLKGQFTKDGKRPS
ncbi:hypothetical protein GE061_019010 [Apolygus lucorum]|uniref:Secreted protein n=1 Tax=Apolygus lucorum TaxID=248454 RepID=A0A8S9X788_APOLU|nr:hypothetical protein GE061_019010 [Apolygus lucorum]